MKLKQRLYLILGTDAYARQNKIHELTGQWLAPEWQDLNLERYDHSQSIATVLDGWLTPPFWGERRVIVAEVQGDVLQELLTELGKRCAQGAPDTENILIMSAEKVDKRRKGLKDLLKQIEVIEFSEVKRWNVQKELYPWVDQQLQAQGKRISRQALKELVEASGTDKFLLRQQLDKLLMYLGADPQIELEMVQKLVPRTESDIFLLLELLAARQPEAAYGHLQTLLLREHPSKIMAALGTSLVRLYRTRWSAHLGQNHQDIAQELGLNPYVVKMDLQRWGSYRLESLEKGLKRLLELQTRTHQSRLKPDLALEIWLGDMLQS